ncbi:MAG TPA: enoyl-CoA hydratase/isomerase family protein [Actinomycetota bacterium]|nr:enoyl-CoA hydratase/isomerase family protein [Actinomycetota bacterium]
MTVRAVAGGPVAEVVLDRAEARNALSVEMCHGIVAALDDLRGSADARCVLLRGEGKVFCSGADFAAVSGPGGLEFLPAFEAMLDAVATFPLPVVAVVQGAALGGGLQLATVCDFRIAADDAKLGIPAARIGIVVNFENVERLVRLAGVAPAKEILMAGHTLTGAGAAARGLVTRAVPAPDLETAARSFAMDVAALSPQSVQGAKRAIGIVERALAEARSTHAGDVADVDDRVASAYGSTDLQEGLAAMADRREPRFENR